MSHRAINLLALAILIGYAAGLWCLQRTNAIDESTLVSGLALLVGWLLTLLIAWLHLQKSLEDNREAARLENQRQLKRVAVSEVLEATHHYSIKVGSIATYVGNLVNRLKCYPPQLMQNEAKKAAIQDLPLAPSDLLEAHSNWGAVIEANQLTLLDLDHYRLHIQHEALDRFNDLLNLSSVGYTALLALPQETEALTDFAEKAKEVSLRVTYLQAYLYDYRIILLNTMLGDVFDSRVPCRKPLDPEFRRLDDVSQEEVELEAARREAKAMSGGTEPEEYPNDTTA